MRQTVFKRRMLVLGLTLLALALGGLDTGSLEGSDGYFDGHGFFDGHGYFDGNG